MQINTLSESLLKWYDIHGRNLPWREEQNPYHTWISEIMLQQTQVETVIPYFLKWLERFPDITTLATANLDDLLKMWEGLGYYNRCRNIHEAAKIITRRHNNKIPDSYESLILLPGIGPYTAGAILSIGFNKKHSALDANVNRIMSRLLLEKNSNPGSGNKRIQQQLDMVIPDDRPGDFNQALMDLGSMICIPDKPNCKACPISRFCQAHSHGLQAFYPGKKERKTVPVYSVVTGLIRDKNKFYIQKRGPAGHLGGLWEFPGGKIQKGETKEEALKREIFEECGFHVTIGRKIGSVKHAYSHFKIEMTLFECTMKDKVSIQEPMETKWISSDEINNYAFPKANHKLFDILFN